MYAYLKGIIAQKYTDRLIVEVAGIGYNVAISPGRLYDFPECGEETKVYTYTCVREDELSLYGFVTMEELELFKLLISVSGIGPKGGLAMLSVMSVDDVKYAIMTGDSGMLAKAPGIGKKTAERVIIDLKDKVKADAMEYMTPQTVSQRPFQENPEAKDAVQALTALGYAVKDAEMAVTKAVQELSGQDGKELHSDAILKSALKYIL
ncbi:MAG: Holliday junction branch migration protein RuvA [Lachnospiraceae bacterium]